MNKTSIKRHGANEINEDEINEDEVNEDKKQPSFCWVVKTYGIGCNPLCLMIEILWPNHTKLDLPFLYPNEPNGTVLVYLPESIRDL